METTIKKEINLEEIQNADENDLFYFVDNNSLSSERITAPKYSYWKSVFRVFFRKKINWIIMIFFVLLVLSIIIFPIVLPYNQYINIGVDGSTYNDPALAMSKWGWTYCLGTGAFGQSIFIGLWTASAISLGVATICAAINMTLGILIGAVWGYSKQLDFILNIVYNIIANIPYILLASVLMFILQPGVGTFILALTITGWIGIAYFFRTQVLIIRDREYNLASRCLGTRTGKVVTRNILPFLISVIVTILATELPSYISMEVFLSYIGLGLKSTTSLGQMISAFQTSFTVFPWGFWPPVAMSAAITIILYILGQNLADASDPRSHMQ